MMAIATTKRVIVAWTAAVVNSQWSGGDGDGDGGDGDGDGVDGDGVDGGGDGGDGGDGVDGDGDGGDGGDGGEYGINHKHSSYARAASLLGN